MIINLNSQIDLSGFYIVYNGSTLNESENFYGINHLMEHLITKNLDNYLDEFNAHGIEYNAITTNNYVIIYLTGLEENLKKYRRVLLNNLTKLKIDENDLEKEKKIVLEEYNDKFNDQILAHILNRDRIDFNYYNPIGLENDIKNIELNDCYYWFDEFFSHPVKIINVSKKEYQNRDIIFKKENSNFLDKFEFKTNIHAPIRKHSNSNSKVSVYVRTPLYYSFKKEMELISLILGSGLKSPLMRIFREENGYTYDIIIDNEKIGNWGYLYFSFLTSIENKQQVKEKLKKFLNNIKDYITPQRFENIKKQELYKLKEENILRYENVDTYLLPGQWQEIDNIKNITYNNVMKASEEILKNWLISFDDEM